MKRAAFHRCRRGAESVEAAVALPTLLLVLFGGFEYGWAVLKSVQLDHAARIGARAAALSGTSAQDVSNQVQQALNASGIADATITFEPTDPSSAVAGDAIVVKVEAPYASNRLLGLSRLMPLPSRLTGRAAMVKEPDA
jgi:Flp pilus assembly protein TadG